MTSSHSHHKQEHNNLHHGKKPPQGFETSPVQPYPISGIINLISTKSVTSIAWLKTTLSSFFYLMMNTITTEQEMTFPFL